METTLGHGHGSHEATSRSPERLLRDHMAIAGLITRLLIRAGADKHTSAHSPELAGLRALGRYAPCRACLLEIAAEQRQFLQRAGTSCPALGAPPAASGLLFEDRFTGGQPASSFRPSPGYSPASGQPLLCRGETRLPARAAFGRRGFAPSKLLPDLSPSAPARRSKLAGSPTGSATRTGAIGPHRYGSPPTTACAPGSSARPAAAAPPQARRACHGAVLGWPPW